MAYGICFLTTLPDTENARKTSKRRGALDVIKHCSQQNIVNKRCFVFIAFLLIKSSNACKKKSPIVFSHPGRFFHPL